MAEPQPPSGRLVVLFCDDDDGWGTQLITFGPCASPSPEPGEDAHEAQPRPE